MNNSTLFEKYEKLYLYIKELSTSFGFSKSKTKKMFLHYGEKEISRHTHKKVAGIVIIKLKKQP